MRTLYYLCNVSVNLKYCKIKGLLKNKRITEKSKCVEHCYFLKSFKKDTEKHKAIFLKKNTSYKVLLCTDEQVGRQTSNKLLVGLQIVGSFWR